MIGKKSEPGFSPTVEIQPDTVDTLIGRNSVLKGDLEFSGGLRVDGCVKGNITALDGNNGSLVLSESGEIEGNVTVSNVVVNGAIRGNITSNGRVELQEKSHVTGDVQYNTVEMALGANVNGNISCSQDNKGYDAPTVTAFDVEEEIA